MAKRKAAAKVPTVRFRPLHDYVLVDRKPQQQESSGEHGVKLLVPERYGEKNVEGVVVRVGEGRWTENGVHIPVPMKPGDRVMWGKFSGTPIVVDGKEYLLIRAQEGLGVVE